MTIRIAIVGYGKIARDQPCPSIAADPRYELVAIATTSGDPGLGLPFFPTPADLASWAGICPGNNASGGKRRSGRTRHGSVWLRTVLTEAAQAAARTKGTYLGAHHATVRGRRGRFKAIGATRHDLLIAYWHVVHDEVNYRELGADWAVRRYSPEHQLNRLIRQIERLGKIVTVTDAA